MTPQELVQIIKQHERFVSGKPDGARANLQYQDLAGLRLPGLNLSHSVASGANFGACQMMGTDFSHADLFATDFRDANLAEVNFDRADLRAPGSTARPSPTRPSARPICAPAASCRCARERRKRPTSPIPRSTARASIAPE